MEMKETVSWATFGEECDNRVHNVCQRLVVWWVVGCRKRKVTVLSRKEGGKWGNSCANGPLQQNCLEYQTNSSRKVVRDHWILV